MTNEHEVRATAEQFYAAANAVVNGDLAYVVALVYRREHLGGWRLLHRHTDAAPAWEQRDACVRVACKMPYSHF